MNLLTASLCLSIGCAVAWLIALYTSRGFERLIWDTLFAIAGAVMTALAIAWTVPALGVVGLLIAGPVFAALAIFAGHGLKTRAARALHGARK